MTEAYKIFALIVETYICKHDVRKNNDIYISSIKRLYSPVFNFGEVMTMETWGNITDKKISKLLYLAIPYLPNQINRYNLNKIIKMLFNLSLWNTMEIIIKKDKWCNINIMMHLAESMMHLELPSKEKIIRFMNMIEYNYSNTEIYDIVKKYIHDAEFCFSVINIASKGDFVLRKSYLYHIYETTRCSMIDTGFYVNVNANKKAKYALRELIADENFVETLRGAWIMACIRI
jgi:hypothetical protein